MKQTPQGSHSSTNSSTQTHTHTLTCTADTHSLPWSRMASPRFTLVAVVLLLAALTLTEAIRGSGPKRCCSRFHTKPVDVDKVKGYVRTSQRCPQPGVILKLIKSKTLCVKPTDQWVKSIIKQVDARPGENVNL